MILNEITIELNVYVPELTKREHLPGGYWTLAAKRGQNVRELSIHKVQLFFLFAKRK